ncbi:MAG TPA: helix-turn-helix domain-containing protein, partial [Gemmatimonadaceae bacterium]|nr:helix-turn-helix domain-containing protein [Gemmatimonadaceae bacterium]
MPKAKKTLQPQQERSRESERKLLKAAAEVLGQHGVEGATIPRIARHAGLTPGAVYRRFRDKDELL